MSDRVPEGADDLPVSPLLEFDPSREAFIEPGQTVPAHAVPTACVITFFGDAVQRLVDEGRATVLAENRWEDGPHPLYEVDHGGRKVALLRTGVGAPLSAGLLEETIAKGCRQFVVCGGAGALRAEITRGHLVVLDSAVRDEGTSHHYLPAGRVVVADEAARAVLEQTLADDGLPFVTGRTWTTDAPYRETPDKIRARVAEGCVTVEMEAAALMAVARFRGVPLAQVVYGGDDLSGDTWDRRAWQDHAEVRDELVRVSCEAALRLAAE